ncbi:uncharacterized protein IL334_003172 [Kwoniella shivajii]|uniref:ML-like domain-containing protein n=1 Tax=Kwoniella shivajii TaxID=564305 RepID=A0ABZ1CWT7_9TREE|nr:hypothetical protein IL334_003172 [Kwoniella shivajii]
MFGFLPILLLTASYALGTPLKPTFTSCLSSYSPIAAGQDRLNVTDIYAEILPGDEAKRLGLTGDGHRVLRIDLVGVVGSEVTGYDNVTNKLATLFTDTKAASFNVYQSTSWLCNSLFPPELPTPYYPYNTTYCPLPAGNFAINITVPLYKSYALTTLQTEVRIVDTSLNAANLACIDIQVSPYNRKGWYYKLFLWLPVSIAIGFWIVSWGARFITGWIVGSGVAEYDQKEKNALKIAGTNGPNRREVRLRKWGTMIISGLSGERLSVSGGLLRFVTPSLKDIMFHIQFCTMLGMIAVNWPGFAYPIFARGAWADLVWNTTLVQGSDLDTKRINTYPANYTPPTAFATQMNDAQYPLYLDSSTFNPLFDNHDSAHGIASFATAVGLRPQDLFGTCLAIFLLLTAAVFIISIFVWALHALFEYLSIGPPKQQGSPGPKRSSLGSSPRGSLGAKEAYDPRNTLWSDGPNTLPTRASLAQQAKASAASPLRRIWLRFKFKGEAGAFHAAALYGNLIRLILIFHLPITIFSIYQLIVGGRASIVSRVFAALAFVFISVTIPAYILYRISRAPSGKLYDATRTLLSLGPMYNIYVESKQMYRAVPLTASLIVGIVVGAGQKSGIVQAVIIILVELAMLIIPGVWYPWGEGASMGASNAFLGLIRLCTAVLVMLLSSTVALNTSANDWITYAILILQAIAFVFFLLMLITKLIEGAIRVFGTLHFDESTHPLDGGIFAAIMDLDCLNGVRGGKAAARKRRKRGSKQLQRNVSAAGSLTTQMMLDRHSQGVTRPPVTSEGTTPFLSPGYPAFSMQDRQGYFPGYVPPLGPPPPEQERLSSESRSAEGGGDNIMDAWRPSPVVSGYAAPGAYVPSATSPVQGLYPPSNDLNRQSGSAPSRSFSVIKGGRADFQNPYDVLAGSSPSRVSPTTVDPSAAPPQVRVAQVSHRPMSPPHNRQQSSSAVIELATPIGSPNLSPQSRHTPLGAGGSSRQSQQGIRPNNEGLRPPALAIPKRRSLNDLKNDPSPDSQYSTSTRKKHKRGKSAGWFARANGKSPISDESEEETDDEPGPSRRKAKQNRSSKTPVNQEHREPLPFEPVPLSPELEQEKSNGFRFFTLGRKKRVDDEFTAQARDENKARKAALAAESGALLAGVEAPTTSPSSNKAFVVKRPGPITMSSLTSQTQSSSPSNYAQASSTFKVKRTNQPVPTPSPQYIHGNPYENVNENGNYVASVHPSPNPGTSSGFTSVNVTPGSISNKSNNGVEGNNSTKGFKVLRPPKFGNSSPQTPQTSSIPSSASRSQSNTPPSGDIGYPPTAFVPISSTTSLSQPQGQSKVSNENSKPGGLGPARPTRDPRRLSGEMKR